jgi:YhcH/YjgK/YiaL family protein
MIIDRIENEALYSGLGVRIEKGLEYLKNTDLTLLENGKFEIADGVRAIVSEYSTKNDEDCKLEAHKKHIDIQCIISGKEFIGYVPLIDQKPTVAYNEEKDVVFYNEEVEYSMLEPGMFAIYYPTDLHKPGIKIDTIAAVKKIVIKVLA